MAQLAVACMCGPLPHVISGPQSTRSVSHACGENKAQPCPQSAAAHTGPWESSKKFHLFTSHLGRYIFLRPHLSQLQSPAPADPLQKRQSSCPGVSSTVPGICDCVGHSVPARHSHTEGTSEEGAPTGPPRCGLPLAPSDFTPGTPPGLVTKSPRTDSH